jgi:hypothetical protein
MTAPPTARDAPVRVPLRRRPVVWAGTLGGTVAAVWAVRHGFHMPGLHAAAGSVLATWLLFVVAVTAVLSLARRHHRTAATAVARGTRRASVAAYQHAVEWATPRWESRTGITTEPFQVITHHREEAPMADTRIADDAAERAIADRHRARTWGRPRPVAAVPTSPSWQRLAADVAQFEPEADSDLLQWATGEAAGAAAYSEAVAILFETCTETVGLHPAAVSVLRDVAEVMAVAAQRIAEVRAQYSGHYAQPNEYVSNGGQLAYRGRFHSGEEG